MILSTLLSLAFSSAALSVPPQAITLEDLDKTERFLASPALEGRMTLSRGGIKAGDFLAARFKELKLAPGEGKSYFYEFPVTFGFRPTKDNKVEFTLADGSKVVPKIGDEYRPLVNSSSKPVSGGMAFVGYGLDRDDWNDYTGIDVKGKVVVVFRGVPEGQLPSATSSKARVAADKGAIGVIFVGPAAAGRGELPNYTRGQGLPTDSTIAGAAIRTKFFQPITGLDYAVEHAMKKPHSVDLKAKVSLTTGLEPNSGMGRDVVGILPGHDPKLKDEYIIFGAHYDHLGYGEVGSMSGSDAIHPGADDNASGSSGVVALAKYFAKQRSNKRTMIFELYQGEELGLFGSDAWAKGHPETLKETTAMLNMDMIGRLRSERLEIYGTGTAKEWTELLNEVPAAGLKPILSPFSRNDSDQASFARRNVPVLFFFTGMHREYHTEMDTYATINVPGMATVARYVAAVAQAVDAAPKLTYAEPVTPGQRDPTASSGQGRRIRVGFVPDMTDNGKGVLLAGVSSGSPAEKAGLKTGDRIVEFNGKVLADLEGLQAAMMELKPGQKVKVVYEREGKRQEATVTVEARTGD